MVDWDSNKLVHQHTPGVGGLHQGEQHPHQQLVPGSIILGKLDYNNARVQSVDKGPKFFVSSIISKRRNHAWSFFCPLCTFMEWCVLLLAMVLIMNWSKSIDCVSQIIIKCQLCTKYSNWNWYNFDLDNQICNTFHNNAWRIQWLNTHLISIESVFWP